MMKNDDAADAVDDVPSILDALREASMGKETELETALRLVKDYRYAPGPTNDATGNYYQMIVDMLWKARQGSESALETATRLVDGALPTDVTPSTG